MFEIKSISGFYVVGKFNKHKLIRNDLLKKIDHAQYQSPQFDPAEVHITKTDWDYSTDPNRPWFQYILPHLTENISQMYESFGYHGFTLNEIWFQQYAAKSEHGWHTHSGNFTNVYYLELPDDSPKTILQDPLTKKRFELEVSEGDFVCFPSFIVHKSPKNNSNERKTIISYNTNVTYPDNFYERD